MTKTIWVVDDDEEMLHAVKLMMSVLDYTAVTFLGARLMVQALQEGRRPDLILLDINMPEVTGLDLLEYLRRNSSTKYLPVVMLSTEASDVMIERARQIGSDGYVSKPVTIEELEHVLEQALEKRNQ